MHFILTHFMLNDLLITWSILIQALNVDRCKTLNAVFGGDFVWLVPVWTTCYSDGTSSIEFKQVSRAVQGKRKFAFWTIGNQI